MAFGTGQHATTQLCLGTLESIPIGRRLLDVGTGTGILAIAAAKAGWGEVVASDIDPDSIMAARRNAEVNKVAINLFAGSFPPDTKGHGFDIVVANILAVVLLRLMKDLGTQVVAGGHLILSGLLVEDETQMITAAAEHGLAFVSTLQQDGWSALLLRRTL